MPAVLSYPGVYIEEVSSGVHTIAGVATSITAFVGRAQRGAVDDPIRVQSFGEFERQFGGLWTDSALGHTVSQFFQNGGGDALIVRVYHAPSAAQTTAGANADGIAALDPAAAAAQGTLTLDTNPASGETMTIDTKIYTFDPAAVAAQGTLTLKDKPNDGETMTVGNVAYTLQDVLTNVGNNIQIGADAAATQVNIVDAINHTGVPGTQYSTAITQPNPDVKADTAFAGDKLLLTAKAPGTAGNALPFTKGFASVNNVVDGAGTLGGTRPGTDLSAADGHIAIGDDLAATQDNIVRAINLNGTAGTNYATGMTKHTTVTAAAFAANKMALTAINDGDAGNSIATTETFAAPTNVFDGATLGKTRKGLDALAGTGLVAASPGKWANNLRVTVDYQTRDTSDTKLFNIEFQEINPNLPASAPPLRSEKFLNVSVDTASPLFVDKVLKSRSALVRVGTTSASRPSEMTSRAFTGGSDGQPIDDNDISAPALENPKKGLWALQKADLFNLLCIPPLTDSSDIGGQTRAAAAKFCKERRALFIVDPLRSWDEPKDLIDPATGLDSADFGLDRTENAALYFPMLRVADPLRDGQIGDFAPCGAVAGVMARTDVSRGVWKAPAGIEATLSGASALSVKLTDGENGQLNPLGINCLRAFPVIGRVVWGARTLRGADQLASEWKYVPVRRLALFLEESLYRGTQWVVFEPNDEPLWAQIRLNVGAFLNTLFRQGAFQGRTPREAYFVKCDKDTTTQNDINAGVVNIVVGFAPLKPAEFVVIKIQQIAGQIET